MDGQDWLDVEPFFDAIQQELAPAGKADAEGWQPIEAAPKGNYTESTLDPAWIDPPLILLYCPNGTHKVVAAHWDWYYSEIGSGYEQGTSAWIEPCTGDRVSLHYDEPTHWMPLPAAPDKQ